MLARFFVDRPIFATVISVVITLAGGVAVFALPVAQYPDVTPPTVLVTALYPGANAGVVQDTVAAPIEEQVSGVEGMMYMSSRCTNDGAYALTVTFKQGMDSDMAQVLVQNRVSLALPVIPALVQNEGITVKKQSPNTLMIVNLISPDGRYDDLFLSNYATIDVRDELGRLPGVAGVSYLGQRDYSLRAWLNADKLAGLGVSGMDVVTAISQQNIQVAAGSIGQRPTPTGQQFQLTITTQGRLVDPDQFADIIIKGSADGGAASSMSTGGATATAAVAGGGATANDINGPTTALVRLRDVARVERGAQQYDQSCTLDGKPSVALSVYALPGSNALETADGVYKKMEELKKRFPDGLDYKIVYDTTPFIRESVDEVFNTLRDAVILVAIVVLLFLQDWRAMILPMIDVPVSLIGTFAVMALMGFTLNNLTLFGLVLAIGIVVDDAIVVLENIERQMATGLDPRTATIKAMEEITGPVLAITLVLSAVFVPCCFLGGMTGQFFRQFAVTIAVSTIISAINALTMTPSRAVLIFKSEPNAHGHAHYKREALPWWIFAVITGILTYRFGPDLMVGPVKEWLAGIVPPRPVDESHAQTWTEFGTDVAVFGLPGVVVGALLGLVVIRPVNAVLGGFFRWFNRGFDKLTDLYGFGVRTVVRLALVVLLIYGGLLVATYFQFVRTPTGFIPQQDKGYLIVNVQLPDSASVERTEAVMKRIETIAREATGVEHTLGISGRSVILNANAPNLGSMYVMLKPFSKRRDDASGADAVAAAIQARCKKEVDEAIVTTFGAPPVDGLGTTGGFNLVILGRGDVSAATLKSVSDRIVDRGNNTPGLEGVFNGSGSDTPWLYLELNRDKCRTLGVQVNDIFNTLQVYLGSYYVNNFNEFGRTWQVNVQADQKFRVTTDDILQLQVRNIQGQMVRLGTVMTVRDVSGPVVVMRYNMYAAANVIGNPGPGTGSAKAMRLMEDAANKELPLGMQTDWTELGYLQNQAGDQAMYFFALAVAFVFLVLAAQYESWKLPLAVILVVPMCLLCSVLGVELAGIEVTIFTQIGFVVLVGLACKNAILIVEFAKQRQDAGATIKEATIEASRLRLRPIVMTSFAFIFGVVPLVYAHGAGAEMRQSLGIAVFSGMLGVTMFGIFLTPAFYYVIQWFGKSEPATVAPLTPSWPADVEAPVDPSHVSHHGVNGNGNGHAVAGELPVALVHSPHHSHGAVNGNGHAPTGPVHGPVGDPAGPPPEELPVARPRVHKSDGVVYEAE
ncbi:efflux RND transporter permease subunit [Fimbriiglobus ruber]|uniref:RND efflux system, inner membrane transporter CmeB n=1 Tax=Fimbriiglobus ruber TaxID=1908690 RepID=A0A225DY38_9BACT|nr:efflux RND transporter permease subunit [Fimbriiglobus ruber]OWK43448.1 RND efflux system, inner membrane transporter CmeB [Fimbriiglobus ruber]